MSIPRILHTVWLGDKPLPSTFHQPLPSGWTWKFWTETTAEHGLGLKPWQYEHATFAGSSNIIRLHAVKQFGGIYLDTDIDLIRPELLDTLLDYPAWVCRQPDGVLCNAAFGATANHSWVCAMIERYGDLQKQDASRGCYVMEECITPTVKILPTDYFYTHNFDQPPQPPTDQTIGIHKWEASWIQR